MLMSVDQLDQTSYRESLNLDFSEITKFLAETIGYKLTAYIAHRRHTDRVQAWIDGKDSYGDVEPRLRLAYRVVRLVKSRDASSVVAAWLQGLNPELDDRVPIVLLREGNPDTEGKEVLAAARAFVAGG